MDVADEIIKAREYGTVRCGVSARSSPTLAELAAEFGLNADPSLYLEIDADAAQGLVEYVLRTDQAWGSEVMPSQLAAQLAHRFLTEFGYEGVRFFTNGRSHSNPAYGPPKKWSSAIWNCVTEATADAGILVLGPERSGCLWVEDEE